jgi:hypothetical protein
VTPADLVEASLKRLRVVMAGGTPSAEDQADAFTRLNSLVRSWSLQPGTIHQVVRTTWTITASQASYTVGTSGNVAITRPASPSAINGVTVQDTSQSPVLEYPAVTPMDEDAYMAIPQKALTSTLPTSWYYAPTTPTGTLYPIPIPTSTTLQGVIYVPTPVAEFAALSTTIFLPDGYDLALTENLAVLLAPEFGVPLDPVLVQSARESKRAIVNRTARVGTMDLSAVAGLFGRHGGHSDIYSGTE